MSQKYWKEKHLKYKNEDWIVRPTLFAQDAVKYFPKKGHILELGAGQGQDTRFFAERGYDVVSTDLCEEALKISRERTDKKLKKKIKFQTFDIADDFPFKNESFDAVYAHLSLHYFNKDTTTKIFHEISRVLKKGGIFAFIVNSANDPEYKNITTSSKIALKFFKIPLNPPLLKGEDKELARICNCSSMVNEKDKNFAKIEDDYFEMDGLKKRFFTLDFIRKILPRFNIILLDEFGETYKDRAKGVDGLIRFIGEKPKADKKYIYDQGENASALFDGKRNISSAINSIYKESAEFFARINYK